MARAVAITLILVITASAVTAGAAWRLKPKVIPPAPQTQPVKHVVASGETLGSISTRYYGSPDLWPAIAEANNITRNTSLLPGTALVVPGITSVTPSLWNSVLFPVCLFALLTILASGFVVREAGKIQQIHLDHAVAAYAVLLTALAGASVISAALSGLILWPGILNMDIMVIPFYAVPAWVFLTASEGYVLHLATGISHGRAVILGVALNFILGISVVIMAVFVALKGT